MKGLRKRGQIWHIEKTVGGVRICKSLNTEDYGRAIQLAQAEVISAKAEMVKRPASAPLVWEPDVWHKEVITALRSKKSWLGVLIKRTAERASAKGLSYSLTPQDWMTIALRCSGHCEVSHVALNPYSVRESEDGRKKRRPWAPSLDRIDSSLGYVQGNCRMVCIAANIAMSTWGENVLRRMAFAMVANHSGEFTAAKN